MTSAEGIQKFKELYRQKTGIELTQAQAAQLSERLLRIYGLITGPMPKTWLPRYLELLKEHLENVEDLVHT